MEESRSKKRTLVILFIVSIIVVLGYLFVRPLFTEAPMEPSSDVVVGFPSDFSPNSAKYFGLEELYIVNNGEGIYAVTSLCSHLKCKLDWNSSENEFECGCHGSEFSREGEVLKSPAQKPLQRYEIRFSKDVGLIVNKRVFTIKPSEWKNPRFYFKISTEEK